MNRNNLLLVLSALFLSGCDDEKSPPDPGIAGMATLEGVDSDDDGVRDDIQRYIVQTYLNEEVQEAMTGLAIAYQDTLLKHDNEEESIKQWSNTSRALYCLYVVDPETAYDKQKELRSITLNTRDRIEAYFEADKHFSGKTLSVPSYRDSQAICDGSIPASKVRE